MEINWLAVLVAAFVPMVMGFIYYNPKVVGTAWMNASGMTEEKAKGANMPLIFGLAFFFSFMLAMSMNSITIHQFGVPSLFVVNGQQPAPGSPEANFVSDFLSKYGSLHRTFTHGLVHGMIMMVFFGLPIMATNALFERRSVKYVLINFFYWFICIGIMGGIVCSWPK
ncbi:MAG: DUF1761 family protein [Bacteroidetes bacterium]|nr:DUF1761 family protein [Bacteroidota bacterium]